MVSTDFFMTKVSIMERVLFSLSELAKDVPLLL